MQRFSGLEIKPYSQLTELPRVRIDRVRVEVQRTLFGETEYHLVGTMGDEGKAYPICAPFTELPDVWERKKEVESAIFKARQEEQYAKKNICHIVLFFLFDKLPSDSTHLLICNVKHKCSQKYVLVRVFCLRRTKTGHHDTIGHFRCAI